MQPGKSQNYATFEKSPKKNFKQTRGAGQQMHAQKKAFAWHATEQT